MKKGIRIWLCVCAALGWWGFLYPELGLPADVCRVIQQDGESVEEREAFDGSLYWEVLEADRGQVRFRSRLLDGLAALYRRAGYESGE